MIGNSICKSLFGIIDIAPKKSENPQYCSFYLLLRDKVHAFTPLSNKRTHLRIYLQADLGHGNKNCTNFMALNDCKSPLNFWDPIVACADMHM